MDLDRRDYLPAGTRKLIITGGAEGRRMLVIVVDLVQIFSEYSNLIDGRILVRTFISQDSRGLLGPKLISLFGVNRKAVFGLFRDLLFIESDSLGVALADKLPAGNLMLDGFLLRCLLAFIAILFLRRDYLVFFVDVFIEHEARPDNDLCFLLDCISVVEILDLRFDVIFHLAFLSIFSLFFPKFLFDLSGIR